MVLYILYYLLLISCTAYAHTSPHESLLLAQAAHHYMDGNYRTAANLFQDIRSTNLTACYHYGLCCHHLGLFEDAHEAFLSTFAYDPTYGTVRSKLRLHALRTQQWDNAHQYGLEPYWWYEADIHGKKILCTSNNAGIGDIIQFLRYLKRLHQEGTYIILEAPTYLHAMLRECPFIDTIVAPNSNHAADITYRVSTPELTLTMHDTLQKPSDDIPYIYANKEREQHWQSKLAQDSTIKIGLCWRSSMIADSRTGTLIPSARSIPLSYFKSLFNLNGCSFYSLQVGHGTEELDCDTYPIHVFDANFDKTHGPFSDTLAVMKQLDLILTVDTSIAHIAGALGVPVWVILPVCSDFRWFLNTDTSPWYPTMKLFRQKEYEDWDTVIEEVRAHLLRYIE